MVKKESGRKYRKTVPKVAVLLESSHEISRGMIRGIFKYTRIYGGWQIELAAGGPNDQRLPNLNLWKGDGIIGRFASEEIAKTVIASGLPRVAIDPRDSFLVPDHPLAQCSSVRCDSIAVGEMAAEYFMNLGFNNYAFVGELTGINWSRDRERAFCRKLNEFHFSCAVYPPPTERNRDWQIEEKIMIRWLKSLPKPTALFVANDHRARQVLDASMVANIPVPYSVAVLGVNNDELICQTTWPALSSIALDAESAGYQAAALLDELMAAGRNRNQMPLKVLTFPPLGIVERETTQNASLRSPKVIQAVEFIRINAGLNIRVTDVARHLGVTRQWAERMFRLERGCSILDEIKRVRMRTIGSLVAGTDKSFNQIASECGFEGSNHLGIIFKREFGMTMTDYRRLHSPAPEGNEVKTE